MCSSAKNCRNFSKTSVFDLMAQILYPTGGERLSQHLCEGAMTPSLDCPGCALALFQCMYLHLLPAIMQWSCDPAGIPSHCPLCICTQSSLSLRTSCVYTLACIAQNVSSNFRSILPVSKQIHTLTARPTVARYHKVRLPYREGLDKPSSALCVS